MKSTRTRIIEAATQTFARYGARKTAMIDIAGAAGVSRQTLYAIFGSKDELVVASINHVAERNFAIVEQQLADCSSLAEKLEVYFRESIVTSFELIEGSEDLEDIVSGHSEAGRIAIANLGKQHEKLLSRLLTPHQKQIKAHGQTVKQLARFCATCARGFKYSARNKKDLIALIDSLKTSMLLAAGEAVITRAEIEQPTQGSA